MQLLHLQSDSGPGTKNDLWIPGFSSCWDRNWLTASCLAFLLTPEVKAFNPELRRKTPDSALTPQGPGKDLHSTGREFELIFPKFCRNTITLTPGAGILQIFMSNTFHLQTAPAMLRRKQNNSAFTLLFESLSLSIPDYSHFARPSVFFKGMFDYFGALEAGFFFLCRILVLWESSQLFIFSREHFYLHVALSITW